MKHLIPKIGQQFRTNVSDEVLTCAEYFCGEPGYDPMAFHKEQRCWMSKSEDDKDFVLHIVNKEHGGATLPKCITELL